MPKKQTPTVKELKLLILARINADQNCQTDLRECSQQDFDNKTQKDAKLALAIRNMLVDRISDVVARRLRQKKHTTPLLSPRDFVKIIPLIINEITKANGLKLKVEERKMLVKFMKVIVKHIFEIVRAMVPPHRNPYTMCWQWVRTTLNLAAERGLTPTELFAFEGTADEITRRMFTRKQFVALTKRVINKSMNIVALKKLADQLISEIVAEGDEEELGELSQTFETRNLPQLRETTREIKVIMNARLNEAVKRIYAK